MQWSVGGVLRPAVRLAGIAFGACCGCWEDPSTAHPMAVERDSAGISIVTASHVPPLQDSVYLRRLEFLRAWPNREEPAESLLFYEPQNGLVLDDGRLALLDNHEYRLAVLDSAGSMVISRFGHVGGGPGELSKIPIAPMWVGSEGTFWVYDGSRRHALQFSNDGSLRNEVILAPTGGPLVVSALVATGMGALWIMQFFPGPTFGMDHMAVDSIGVVDLRTGVVDFRVQLPPRVPFTGRQPVWHPRVVWTVLRDGTTVAGRTDLPTFWVHRSSGELAAIIHAELQPNAASDPDRSKVVEQAGPILGITARTAVFNETVPLYLNLRAVDDTTFAIEHMLYAVSRGDANLREDEVAWRLFSTSGLALGTIMFPVGFRPMSLTDGRVLGVLRDTLDVGVIEEYRVMPSRPTR